MTKRKVVSKVELVARADAAARRACVKSLVEWSARPISRESFPDDFPDGFHLHDVDGAGSFEAFAGRIEQNFAPAPCGQCPCEDCPGSTEGCLLNVDQGFLQYMRILAGEEEDAEGIPYQNYMRN